MAEARSDEAPSETVSSVRFDFFTDEEVRKLSVKSISKPDLTDVKGAAVPDGLYDPALGPLKDTDSCKSCFQLSIRCPGHFGHIDLARPIYNPLMFQNLRELLNITCFYCHRFNIKEKEIQKYIDELDLVLQGNIVASRNLRDEKTDQNFSLEKYLAELIAHRTDDASTDNTKEHNFTSLQYTELKSVMRSLLKKSLKLKKCVYCKRESPKITSPMFGWLNKDVEGSAIIGHFILESNLGLASIDGDQLDANSLPDIENGEVLQSEKSPRQTDEKLAMPNKTSKKSRKRPKDLPAGFVEQMDSSGQKHLLPTEVEHILQDLWVKDGHLCKIIYDMQCKSSITSDKSKGHSMFFMNALLVPPSKFRPPAGSTSGGVLEHPQNVLLSKVLESNISLRDVITKDPAHPDIVRKWMDLQRSVNIFFNSSKGFGWYYVTVASVDFFHS